MQWIHTHSPNKPKKKFRQTSSACQKADGSCFLGEERSADSGTHAIRGQNTARSVLCTHGAPPRQCVCIRLPALKYWELSDPLLTVLILISLWVTIVCSPIWRSGFYHSISTIMWSWWNVSEHGWAHRLHISLLHRHNNLFLIWQVPRFWWWLRVVVCIDLAGDL
jgi:hypothetical protein